MEPADLWQRYIDPKYKDPAPIGRPDEPFSTGNLYPFEGTPFSPTDKGSFSDGTTDWWLTDHVTRHPIEMMYTAVCVINGGVLERFPGLRVGLLEANCSWVPYWLWRMDEHDEVRGFAVKEKLPEPPSSYFLRQCFVSIEADEETACPVMDRIGDNVVFSTDFPHSDSAYPHASEAFLELALTDDQKRRIL